MQENQNCVVYKKNPLKWIWLKKLSRLRSDILFSVPNETDPVQLKSHSRPHIPSLECPNTIQFATKKNISAPFYLFQANRQ